MKSFVYLRNLPTSDIRFPWVVEKTGPNFRANDHVQKLCKYRQNNECKTISMAYANLSHFREFSNRKSLKMHTLVFEKICPGPRRDQKNLQKLWLRHVCLFFFFFFFFFEIIVTG